MTACAVNTMSFTDRPAEARASWRWAESPRFLLAALTPDPGNTHQAR